MKVGVCGIACEKCPRMTGGLCPNGEAGCVPRQNKMCQIASCAYAKGVSLVLRVQRVPMRDDEEGSDKLWLLPVHLGQASAVKPLENSTDRQANPEGQGFVSASDQFQFPSSVLLLFLNKPCERFDDLRMVTGETYL
jgi:hypothetical protein